MTTSTKTYLDPFKMRQASAGGFYILKEIGAHTNGRPMYMMGYVRYAEMDRGVVKNFNTHESRTDKTTYDAMRKNARKNWREMKEVVAKDEMFEEVTHR